MRRYRLPILLLATFIVSPPTVAAQTATVSPTTVEEVIDRVSQTESLLIAQVRELRPIVEAYVQELTPLPNGAQQPTADAYFLGRLDWKDGPTLKLMADAKRAEKIAADRRGYLPDGFAAMAAPDWGSLDRSRYEYKFVRREFLGEIRALVFDISPSGGPNQGFSGRIWVEDRNYHIVRYNGINRNVRGPRFRKKVYLHVDGWRVHAANGLWLPAYVHCEETDLDGGAKSLLVKSQVRFWGYNNATRDDRQQFTAILINDQEVRDEAEQGQLTAVVSQRRWEQEAERNVIDRLEKASLLAPATDVERVLNTVLDNLQAANEIALERRVQARVLLTSPLESFTVGHTIVLSRGLVDVLPDEASLAMALAHELSHVVLGHQLIDTRFAFADRMMIDDPELLATIATRRAANEEVEADTKAIEMLERSPYKDKLQSAGLFLKIVGERARLLPELIQPHVGDHVSSGGQAGRLTELMSRAPDLDHADLTQIPALPVGARLVVDPWDGSLELLKTAAAPPISIREKAPLGVMPLTPRLRYARSPEETPTPTPMPAPMLPPGQEPADSGTPETRLQTRPQPR
jgi:hypothetical protein